MLCDFKHIGGVGGKPCSPIGFDPPTALCKRHIFIKPMTIEPMKQLAA